MSDIESDKEQICRLFLESMNDFIRDHDKEIRDTWNNGLHFYMIVMSSLLGVKMVQHMDADTLRNIKKSNAMVNMAIESLNEMILKSFQSVRDQFNSCTKETIQ